MLSRGVLLLFLMTLGESGPPSCIFSISVMLTRLSRLLDKIAKDIMVCENKTVTRWDGSISQYKKHLRKKMIAAGGV